MHKYQQEQSSSYLVVIILREQFNCNTNLRIIERYQVILLLLRIILDQSMVPKMSILNNSEWPLMIQERKCNDSKGTPLQWISYFMFTPCSEISQSTLRDIEWKEFLNSVIKIQACSAQDILRNLYTSI